MKGSLPDDLGNGEVILFRIRSVRERFGDAEGWKGAILSQELRHVRHMRRGLDSRGVELVQLVDVVQDSIELAGDHLELRVGEFEMGKARNVSYRADVDAQGGLFSDARRLRPEA